MLLTVQDVKKLYGVDIILESVSFQLKEREKVALVGRNGAGKSTLIRLIQGVEDPDGGSINRASGLSIGVLDQHQRVTAGETVLESATRSRAHLQQVRDRMEELEKLLENGASDLELEEYSRLHEHFAEAGGYGFETSVATVLKRLGFEEDDWGKAVQKLSGGEKTRLALAKLLLEEPDLLILDEPTNHLDIDAIEWLENWVRGYPGAVMVVSHDRTFLNAVSERVIELRSGKSRSFPGNFNRYVELAQAEDERLAEVAAKQNEQMAQMEEYVRRFMNSQRTAQARGRLKQLEKLRLQAVDVHKEQRQMAAKIAPTKRAGDLVLEARKVSKSFGDQVLFTEIDWTVRWGEKWGVIGPNGAGKSTLIKIALGSIEADSGNTRIGGNVDLAWFAQDIDFLDLNETPLEAVCGITGMEFGPARNLLGRFLVSGDDALRPLRTMSGGERVKVALACLTGLNPNVLVLDEPTNHLDLGSSEALARVLKEFTGTLILISHDRWLLEQVSHQTLEIREGRATEYQGGYQEYQDYKKRLAAPAKPTKSTKATPAQPAPILLSPRQISKELSQLEKEVAQHEDNIEKLEKDLENLERRMSTPTPQDDVYAMSVEHGEIQTKILTAMDLWTAAGEKIQELRRAQSEGTIAVEFRTSG